MIPKENFLNTQPSAVTNDQAERANDLSTTDNDLEAVKENPSKIKKDGDAFVNSVNDAEEIEKDDKVLNQDS